MFFEDIDLWEYVKTKFYFAIIVVSASPVMKYSKDVNIVINIFVYTMLVPSYIIVPTTKNQKKKKRM